MEHLKEAMDRAYKNMLTEAEITYVLNVLKKKDDNRGNDILKVAVQKQYYDKAKKTFEIVMVK